LWSVLLKPFAAAIAGLRPELRLVKPGLEGLRTIVGGHLKLPTKCV
jgi:hypothetical protein